MWKGSLDDYMCYGGFSRLCDDGSFRGLLVIVNGGFRGIYLWIGRLETVFLSVGFRRLYVWKWVVGDYIFLDVV